MLRRYAGGLNRLAFAFVLGVHGEFAHDRAADALLLPDLVTGGGGNVIAILLVDYALLAARDVMNWVVDRSPVVSAVGVPVDPPLKVDHGGLLMSANMV